MNIAYVATVFPHHSQTFVVNEVVAHQQAGVDVTTISCDRSDDGPHSAVAKELSARTLRPPAMARQVVALLVIALRQPVATLRSVGWLVGLLFIDPVECCKGVKELLGMAAIAPSLRQQNVEMIHVHFASRSLTAGILLGWWTKTPVSCTVHAFDLWGRSARNLRYRLRHCKFIAAISQYNVDYILGKCGPELAKKCHVVHCGIDLKQFAFRQAVAPSTNVASSKLASPGNGVSESESPRILLVARLTEKKGHRYLIEACAKLKERGRSFECVIMGTGPDMEMCRRLIDQLGLEDCVRLTGAIANDQVQREMARCSVFALPAVITEKGDRDGIPVALMEAMACGVPVISTDVSGIPELFRHGEAGCLVPSRDAEKLAEGLDQILTNEQLAEQFSAAGRRVVEEEFDIQKTTATLRELFAEAIESCSAREATATRSEAERPPLGVSAKVNRSQEVIQ